MDQTTQLQKLSIDADKALAEACRRSFFRFVQEFWSVVIPEDPVYNWHIAYICKELQYLNGFVVRREPKPYDLIINVPPGSTKSTIVTQMYNAWVWTVDPTQRIITASYSNPLSLSHSIKTRDIVTSDKYRKLFPEIILKRDQQGKSDFRNTFGGQRFTTSTGGTVTGMHGHQIIVDDPIDPRQSNSDSERETANTFVTSTLSTRKINKAITPTIIVMQRLHEKDPTGVLLAKKKDKIKHICLPAEIRPGVKVSPIEVSKFYKDGLLDPKRLPKAVLEDAKVELGTYGYSGQYDQNPAPVGGGILKAEWFEIIDWNPAMASLKWDMVVDPAYTESEQNDPSGYWMYARTNGLYIVRYAEKTRSEFPDLVKRIISFAHQHGYTRRSMIEIEPKASGKSIAQTIRTATNLNVREGRPPAKGKVERAVDVSPVCESLRVKLIRGSWNQEVIDELTMFPNGEHDEYVDLLTMMISKDERRGGIKRLN